MSGFLQNPIFIIASSFIASLVLTFAVREFARRKGFVAHPKSDRWHKKPTAMLGGVAIFITTLVGYFAFIPISQESVAIIAGASFLFLVGLVDDIRDIKPYQKLIGQLIAVSVVVSAGLHLPWTDIYIIDVWITVFWIVGITNAINLLDNMDGLAAGIALIAAVTLGVSFFQADQMDETLFIAVFVGALIGFLVYNFNPASIFMGDCGSMFIGFLISSTVLLNQAGGRSRGVLSVLAVPVLILFVPIFDTTLVTFLRKLSGRKASQGGRDHTSHRLVALGLSERNAVLMLFAFAAIGAGLALFIGNLGVTQSIALITLFAILLTIIGVFLAKVRVYDETDPTASEASGQVFGFVLNLSHKRRVFEVILDAFLITLAYYSAYLLVFPDFTETSNWDLFVESLPILIVVKLICFLVFGVYRGLWKYAGIGDLLTFTKAVVIGGGISVITLLLLYRFEQYSRTLFVVDAMLLLFAVAGTRLAFRFLRLVLPSPTSSAGRRTLIFGAGDGGELIVRELRNNGGWDKIPIGFVDDDPLKKGRLIQGIPVLGSREDLLELIKDNKIDDVLISTKTIKTQDLVDLQRVCKAANVGLFTAYLSIEAVGEGHLS
jgi:UDP-GlcNAc:undecaprenyl-phosphate GlcNAc-1-phosphate transferase